MKSHNTKFSELSKHVIGAAIEVHRNLGPGLLESSYQQCLAHELKLNNINFTMEHPIALNYKGINLDCGYRADLIVENQIIIEIKSIAQISPIHTAQILSYMKLAKLNKGFLMNFNVKVLKQGLRSYIL